MTRVVGEAFAGHGDTFEIRRCAGHDDAVMFDAGVGDLLKESKDSEAVVELLGAHEHSFDPVVQIAIEAIGCLDHLDQARSPGMVRSDEAGDGIRNAHIFEDRRVRRRCPSDSRRPG